MTASSATTLNVTIPAIVALRGVFKEISVTSINAPWLNCQPVLYEGFNSGLLNTVRENIVLLRDFIAVSSREPGRVEVIGVLI